MFQKRIISLILVILVLLQVVPVLAEEASISTGQQEVTEDTAEEREIIIVNGVEYDVTGWSAADKDALRAKNNSAYGQNTADSALNQKVNPDYDVNDLIENGWSSEEAEIKEKEEPGQGVQNEEQLSKYEAALRFACGIGALTVSEGNFNAGGIYSTEDFKATIQMFNKEGLGYSGVLQEIPEIVTGDNLITYLSEILGYSLVGEEGLKKCRSEITRKLSAVDFSQEISRDIASQLIRNAFGINLIEIYGLNSYKTSDTNLFGKMEISGITGLITATDAQHIFGGRATEKINFIEIDYAPVQITNLEYKQYLGKYVDAFIRTIDGEMVLLSMTINVDEETAKKVTVKSAEVYGVTTSTIIYSVDERRKEADVTETTQLVRNGIYSGILKETSIDLSACDEVTLYDIDEDGVYDWIVVIDFSYYLVDSVNGTTILADNYSVTLRYEDKESIIVYINGELSSIDKINRKNVIAVMDDGNEEGAVVIYVGTESNEGAVTRFSKEDGELELEGEDFVYQLNEKLTTDILHNEYYEIFMDHNGLVAFAKKLGGGGTTSSGRKYAYLRYTKVVEDVEETAHFRMWLINGTEDSEWVTMKVTGKIILEDGTNTAISTQKGKEAKRIRRPAYEIARLPQLQEPQLIAYETDIKGNLSKIILAQDISKKTFKYIDENLFQKSSAQSDGVSFYWQGYLNDKLAYDNKSVVISVPIEKEREDMYQVVVDPFNYDDPLPAPIGGWEFYDVNEEHLLAGIGIRYDEAAAKELSLVGNERTVVQDVNTYYDEEEEEIRVEIICAEGKTYWTNKLDAELGMPNKSVMIKQTEYNDFLNGVSMNKVTDIKPGDVIRITSNTRNEIQSFVIDIRIDALMESNVPYSNWNEEGGMMWSLFHGGNGWRYGEVVKNGNAETTILVNTGATENGVVSAGESSIIYCPERTWGMFEYNRDTREVKKIKRSDLTPGDIFVAYQSMWYIGTDMMIKIVNE